MNNDNEADCVTLPRAEQIARLNDQLRKTCEGGTVVITRNVRGLEGFNAPALVAALANYDRFDEDNDPHGERDFGDLELFEAELLWKVDYFDTSHHHGSADPADANVTSRVLTVMLASEY